MRKNRFLASILTISMLIPMCMTGCSKDNKVQMKDVELWSALNTQNVMREDPIPKDAKLSLSMEGMKGETESIQLMITPKNDVASYHVEVSDLTTSDGAVISAEHIEVFAERYIETKASSMKMPKTTYMYVGWYPDALVPIDRFEKRKENIISAGDNQGIWFNVNIPSDAAAGEYEATVSLTVDEQNCEIPLTLTVYNMTIPEEMHTTSSFGLWYDYISYGEGVETPENISENYYWFMANKRVTPQTVPEDQYSTPEEFAEYIVPFAQNKIVSGYYLPYKAAEVDGMTVIDKEHLIDVLTAVIQKNIELWNSGDHETDLLQKAYVYAWKIVDEPNVIQAPQIKACDRIVTEAKNAVKPLLADYPELSESLTALKNVVSVINYDETFAGDEETGGIQTWCTYVSEFGVESVSKELHKRAEESTRSNKESLWWYHCSDPGNPYTTFFTDDNLISTRAITWMQKANDVSGYLYWCANFYRKCESFAGGSYVTRNVWEDPNTFESRNGDGQLIYPGVRYGLDTPISTLRLESTREANEDYELLWMFENQMEVLNKEHNKQYDSEKILNHYYSRIFDGVVPKTDSEEFRKVRSELLQLVEDMYNAPEEAMKVLDEF